MRERGNAMRCAEAIVDELVKSGVDTVFGYPGANIAPLYEALRKSGIRHILCGNEQFAAMEASGYTAATGKTGVCFVTSGPGAVNMLSGLANAFFDSIPLVVFSGQVGRQMIGTDAFQEADTTGASASFCKHSFLLTKASAARRSVKEAFYIASTGRKGPVLIDLPLDVQEEDVDGEASGMDLPGYHPAPVCDEETLRCAIERIDRAERPLLVVGGGVRCSGTGSVIDRLMEKGFSAVVTMNGRSAVSPHPGNLGMAGVYGRSDANRAVKESDLLILLGTRVTERTVQGIKKDAIHIDIDRAELGKNMEAFTVLADITEALPILAKEVKARKRWITRSEDEEALPLYSAVCRYAAERTADVLTADVGDNLIRTLRGVDEKRRVLTSSGFGSMGYAVPAAIGAASTGRAATAFCGDGGFVMSLSELSVIRAEHLNVRIIIDDNGELGMISRLQKDRCHVPAFATALSGTPQVVPIAEAFGMKGFCITSRDEIEEVFARAGQGGAAIISVREK